MTGAIPIVALLLIIATINAVATSRVRLAEDWQEWREQW
jgi:hypothetical protein